MSAPTHTRSRRPLPPGPATGAARIGAATGPGPAARTGAADARLHWWALALPALAFGLLLLLLLAGSGEARAQSGEASGLLHVTQRFLRAVG